MTATGPYANPAAVRRAIADAAKALPPERRAFATRQFVHDRFLCRVFAIDDGWVLKGGTAMLARVRDARHSLDIDLWNERGDLDAAEASLRVAAARDLGDHLRSELTTTDATASGRKAKVVAWLGATDLERFTVDLIVGSIVTAPIEEVAPANRIELPRLESHPAYRLYPIVDHLADKVCAIHETHGRRPSTRVRDLVDVLIMAATQRVEAEALRIAIETERLHRGMPAFVELAPPATWAGQYARVARDVTDLVGTNRFADAVLAAKRFIDPVLSGTARGNWSLQTREWSGPPVR